MLYRGGCNTVGARGRGRVLTRGRAAAWTHAVVRRCAEWEGGGGKAATEGGGGHGGEEFGDGEKGRCFEKLLGDKRRCVSCFLGVLLSGIY